MTTFLLQFAYDRRDLRPTFRDPHIEYIANLHKQGKVVMGGPFTDATGGVIIFRAPDEAAAWQLVHADPYVIENVIGDLRLREWSVTVPSDE
ncbi:YciI family protein [Rhodococcus sp. NPDC057529]|uniref:YciI family protein n=1 Tax=Rhodococcus sp. NPDC057529 TaxID=3346158 RepID=UPI003671CC24